MLQCWLQVLRCWWKRQNRRRLPLHLLRPLRRIPSGNCDERSFSYHCPPTCVRPPGDRLVLVSLPGNLYTAFTRCCYRNKKHIFPQEQCSLNLLKFLCAFGTIFTFFGIYSTFFWHFQLIYQFCCSRVSVLRDRKLLYTRAAKIFYSSIDILPPERYNDNKLIFTG